MRLWRGGGREIDDGAVDGGGAELLEGEFEAELFHDGEAEVGFVAGRVFDVAVGFVNAHELGAFLELFFGGWHGDSGEWLNTVFSGRRTECERWEGWE